MSNIKVEEKKILHFNPAKEPKSSSISDSYEEDLELINENKRNINLNSNSTNKKNLGKRCKHDFKFLKKFYKKVLFPHKNSGSNNSDKDPNNALDNSANLKSNFQKKQNRYDSEKKPFRSVCFCAKCRGLIIKLHRDSNNDKDKLYTVAYLPSETIKSYISPIELFYNMQMNDANKGLIFINNYSKKRKDMISFLAKLRNKYKLSLDSFYLSIALLDNVCAKMVKFNVDIELLTIGCFFLAGKFLENDAYLGEFELLSNNFKKIFYSVEELHKSEVYCLSLLNFNLSITTAKQYYDVFCLTGFIFDNELNSIKDLKDFYQSGITILKELITDFKSTSFSNLSLAFSVVRYLREANLLESKKPRMHILESIYGLKPNVYFHAWELLKKIKKFYSVCDSNSQYNNGNTKIKLSSDSFSKKNYNGHALIPGIESGSGTKNNKDSYFEDKKDNYESDKIQFNSEKKPNRAYKDLDNPNSIQFKTLSRGVYANNNKIFLNSNIAEMNSNSKDSYNNNNYNINSVNTNLMKTSFNSAAANNKGELPSIRSASFTKGQVNGRYTSNQFLKESEQQASGNNNNISKAFNRQFSLGSKEKLTDSTANGSSGPNVEGVFNKLYSSDNLKKKQLKIQFASSSEIKINSLVGGANNKETFYCNNNDHNMDLNLISDKIKNIVIKNNVNSDNQDEKNFNPISKNHNNNINNNEAFNLEQSSNKTIITKINQQLKSSTTKKLVSINPNSTFNVSSSLASTKGNNSGKYPEEKDFVLKKPSNLMGNSLNGVKVFLNSNAAISEFNSKQNHGIKNELAAAPLRRSSKLIAESMENNSNVNLKKRISKRLSYENLPKVEPVNFKLTNEIINKLSNNQVIQGFDSTKIDKSKKNQG